MINVSSRVKLASARISSHLISFSSFKRFSSNKVPNLTVSMCQFLAGADKTVNINKAEEMISKAPNHSQLLVIEPNYSHSPSTKSHCISL